MQAVPIGEPVKGCDGGLYQPHHRLWDVKSRHPWDRPPKKIWIALSAGGRLEGDTRPRRPPLPKSYPGLDISLLKDKHEGARLILFNGQWPQETDLRRVRVPMIGLNRTFLGFPGFSGPQPDYLCIVDGHVWFRQDGVRNHPAVINGSTQPEPIGYRVGKSYRMRPFSFDLARDGFIPPTTGMLAFQFAVYAGFTSGSTASASTTVARTSTALHPILAAAMSLNNLALLYHTQGQYAQAEPLYKCSLAIREKALGLDHPDVAASLNILAELYHTQGQHVQAEPLYKRSLAIWEKALSSDHFPPWP